MNKLIRHIVIIILFVLAGAATYSQVRRMQAPAFHRTPAIENRQMVKTPAPYRMTRIEAVRENFYSRQLKLNPDQADKFWPVYHQYQQELVAVSRLKRQNNSQAQPNGTEQINKELAYDEQMLAIRKKYNDEFLKILPPEKVSELYKSERAFHDEMLKQLSERTNVSQQPAPTPAQ